MSVGSNRDAIKVICLIKLSTTMIRPCSGVDQVDNDFVARCAASFKAANSGDIDVLVVLVEKASKKAPDDLEQEENEDKASDKEKSGNHGLAEEKKMYDPLVCNTLLDFSLLL
jgi:hypothetical protein